ncbi:MAG: hypothetical protein AAB624_02500, partial [Patescibacteria group bacterium]
MSNSRVNILDHSLAKISNGLHVGNAFVFDDQQQGTVRGGQAALMGGQQGLRVISLFGARPFLLPGISIPNISPHRPLVAVFPTRDSHKPGETVNAFVIAIGRTGGEIGVIVKKDDKVFLTAKVKLDQNGVGYLAIPNIRIGEYELSAKDAFVSARFHCTEHRLAALSCDLLEANARGDNLSVKIRVFSYGEVLKDMHVTVKVLADGEKIIPDRAYFTDRDGVIDAMFAIGDAEGNISVVVVRKEFADQTAEVVVRGAKKSEREAIVASPLGPHVWNAALLSFAATDIPVRGMHFAQGDSVDTPITVDAVIGKTVVVTVLKDAPIIKFAIVDGATGTVHEVVHEDVTKGQTIDMPVSGPMSIVAIGAWFSDENGNVSPWEGWFTAMKPSDLTVTVEVPQRVEPGTEVQIRLKTNRLDKTVSVIVVVQDDRHAQTVTANYALAATMQEILRQMGAELRVGEPLEKIAVTDDDEDYGMRGGVVKASRLGRHEMYRSGPQLQPTGVRDWKYDVVLESAMGAAPTILPLVAALVKSLSGRKKTGKTLYAQIVLVNSEATVSVNVGFGYLCVSYIDRRYEFRR